MNELNMLNFVEYGRNLTKDIAQVYRHPAQTYVAIRDKSTVILETNQKMEETILNRVMMGSANKAEACSI